MGIALLWMGCATPSAPTGGPVDDQPPQLLHSEPADQSTNVTVSSIKLLFNEYLDASSLQRALQITPAFRQPVRIRWRGKEATLVFPEALRPNTTYVLTLGNELRDWNGVQLKKPITLAFSTGAVLNRGQVDGLVLEPKRGNPQANVEVWAWLRNEWIGGVGTEPAYRTQTGPDGRFSLKYLPESPFWVIAVQDRNRNRKIDATEAYAVPPFAVLNAVAPDTSRAARRDSTDEKPARWFLAKADTTAPALRSIRAVSSSRLAVTFSEAVTSDLRAKNWTISDSLQTLRRKVQAVYQTPENLRTWYLKTDSLAAGKWWLQSENAADSSGNVLRRSTIRFVVQTRSDTLKTRFLGFKPNPAYRITASKTVLWAQGFPALQFNQPVDSLALHQNVAVTDTLGHPIHWTFSTLNGTEYEIQPQGFGSGMVVKIAVRKLQKPELPPATRLFERLPQHEQGTLTGKIQGSFALVQIELYGADETTKLDQPYYQTRPDVNGRFVFRGLPEGTYRLRIFTDQNENGHWDAGQISPFTPAEPLYWSQTPIRVRANWEQETEPISLEN